MAEPAPSGAPLVLDTSAAVAVIVGEPAAEEVRSAMSAQKAMSAQIVVPDHFWLELVNVLVRRYRLPQERVAQEIRELDELGVQSVEVGRELVLYALSLMGGGLTAYDAAYLAIASSTGAHLLTLDQELRSAAGTVGVLALPADDPTHRPRHRLAEERAAYASSVGPWAWSGFGRYLAELRRRAEGAG